MIQGVLRHGDTVHIFEDPITREKFEGQAKLLELMAVEPIERGYHLERWHVQFVAEDEGNERSIRVDHHDEAEQPATGSMRISIAEARLDSYAKQITEKVAQVVDMRAKGELVATEFALALAQNATMLVAMTSLVSQLRQAAKVAS